ncbi:hypothetical protein PV646_40870 [Streptomyces sp. ID05-26A]|nr:hypothetical protein [Streptomyces sp. ID05-26A]
MSIATNAVAPDPFDTGASGAAVSTTCHTIANSTSAIDTAAVRKREALPADAVVIVADGCTVAPPPACGLWGLQVIAADTAIDGGQLALFAAQTLTAQPDARAHDGDVVVRLRTAATASADDISSFVDVHVLVARGGRWEQAGTWTGMNADWPHRIAATVIRLMACDAGPVVKSASPTSVSGRFGVLRDLVSAGRLHDGEKLVCARPGEGVRYEAHVVDGGIQLPDGRWFGRPSGALTSLGYPHQNGWHYWCRARDGVPLSQIRMSRSLRSPAQRPSHDRQLSDMVADGTLCAGDELRYVQPRKGVVHTAYVLADGQLQVDAGRRFLTPAAAIRACCHGRINDGWRTWRRVSDNHTLAELWDQHRNRTTPPATQRRPEDLAPEQPGQAQPPAPSTT